MKLNGQNVKFSITNTNDIENYKKGIEFLEKSEKDIRKKAQAEKDQSLVPVELIKASVSMFKEYFKIVTGVDVLKDCEDYIEARQVYEEFMNQVKEQSEMIANPLSIERIK